MHKVVYCQECAGEGVVSNCCDRPMHYSKNCVRCDNCNKFCRTQVCYGNDCDLGNVVVRFEDMHGDNSLFACRRCGAVNISKDEIEECNGECW
jgi:hypothetical protein